MEMAERMDLADGVVERFFIEMDERLVDMGLAREEGFGEYLSLDESVTGYHKGIIGVAFWSTRAELEDGGRSRHYMDIAKDMARREGERDWCCFTTVELPEVLMGNPSFRDVVVNAVRAFIDLGND